jgi:hypothetical protein
MNKILVFKTSVCNQTDISKLKVNFDKVIKNGKWNFDFEDCDNILRIESNSVNAASIVHLLNQNGFECVELED